MTQMIPFEFDQQQVRVVQGDDGEILFAARDVAKALGYAKPENAIDRHCKGTLKRGTPTPSGKQMMRVIRESDVYRLIVKSQLPSAERFEAWVFEEVLPTIRQTGGYQLPQVDQPDPLDESRLRGEMALLQCYCALTRVSESGKVSMLQKLGQQHGLGTHFLPGYVVDGPADAGGQSLPTASATELLERHLPGVITTQSFNQLLADHGFLERKTRRASKGVKGYWAVTEKGLAYGKNLTNPSNPRETQPHWYGERFDALLDAVGLLKQEALL
ncbi:BRO family, N-terminal domain [Halomonas shengliensis]|uniref:BRO family, N-terminal domain n=1 Tax=Halomonas shengliensis TaxID=419597 RepID=A0A1H0IC95_9GAMM|nr:Bro-N domain-containing protein [Halomonas shengliensis]SDO29074.1 BRO family, N-terminal domain [Halomonas shengliensis]